MKSECQNITALSCNLTAETPSVPHVQYQAAVYANGRFHGLTTRLNPIAHTIFGKPILSMNTMSSSLYIRVTLPLGPNGTSVEDIIKSSKNGPITPLIEYTLNITSPRWAAQVHYNNSGNFVVDFHGKTKYCGYVVYKPSHEWGRPESEMADFCETPAYDPSEILPWSLMGVALLAALVMMSVGALCFYVKGGNGRKLPRSLEIYAPTTLPKVEHPPDMSVTILKAKVCTQSEHVYLDKCTSIRPKPNGPSIGTGAYSPQDNTCQPWLGSTGFSAARPNHQDVSSQSSVIYSSVAIAVPTEEKELPGVFLGESEGPLRSSDSQSAPNAEVWDSNPVGQLLLHTVQDINGQLQLPSLMLQLESNTVAHPDPEGKPLLSDLLVSTEDGSSFTFLQRSESSDSGCEDGTLNTPTLQDWDRAHFSTNPTPPLGFFLDKNITSSGVNPQSGYKQNWMPSFPFGSPCNDDLYDTMSNPSGTFVAHPKEMVDGALDKDKGSEEGIYLGGWGLKIQE
ncbi:interferon lambda receptor 1 isoform X2 [Dunckerocampus dactyliophorus]|nr:interferon lambda receptor 1 isoform X2 [Dunckerocampus dactyliophorus]XP_054636629.1 interferon lambda receptor 1 isoform X2 [Dunckerocampus dactyliophorus]XP_054636630.1 interferon lambda receptor 1 isoform X2 [Dunckerocampus dactyliophorus]XP_054636632.1 interferon lambda receptor 1 isoform X2 [Dunckerocampus dactyliophorus]